jgi:hypothetical protein
MSVKCMARVWEKSTQKGSRLLLLLAVADYADDNGFAWPGIEKLAEKTRMSPRQTMRLVEHARKDGELIVVKRRAKGNLYIVTPGLTEEQLRQAAERMKRFGGGDILISDILSLIANSVDIPKVTWESLISDIAVSHESDIAVSPDPSLTVSESSILPETADKKERCQVDPLEHMLEVWQEREGKKSWTVPPEAGGADAFAGGPVDAFCEVLAGISPRKLPDKKRAGWAKRLRHIAEEWEATAEDMERAIRAVPDSDISWKTYKKPFGAFGEDIGALLKDDGHDKTIIKVKR